jgi:hypothetical protein
MKKKHNYEYQHGFKANATYFWTMVLAQFLNALVYFLKEFPYFKI